MDMTFVYWLLGVIGTLIALIVSLVGVMLRMHAMSDKDRMDAIEKREDERYVHFRDRIHDALNAIMSQDNKIVKIETIIELRKTERDKK